MILDLPNRWKLVLSGHAPISIKSPKDWLIVSHNFFHWNSFGCFGGCSARPLAWLALRSEAGSEDPTSITPTTYKPHLPPSIPLILSRNITAHTFNPQLPSPLLPTSHTFPTRLPPSIPLILFPSRNTNAQWALLTHTITRLPSQLLPTSTFPPLQKHIPPFGLSNSPSASKLFSQQKFAPQKSIFWV